LIYASNSTAQYIKRSIMKFHYRFPAFFFIVCLLLPACGNVAAPDVSQTVTPGIEMIPIDLESGYGVRGQWFELYFTNPSSPLAPQGTGGVEGPIVEAIDAARLSVDMAAYSLTLNSVRTALIRAHDRGVTVRIVMESDNMDRSDPQMLIQAGIPIVGDNLKGLMHNKFMVTDKSEVWLGSMNFTDSGTYEDNNNFMRIRSIKVAEDYVTEFEEMFTSKLFGPYIVPQTPNPTVTINGTRVDIYFSPDDGVLNALVPVLNSAQKSIYFLAYSFTTNKLGDIVRAKAQAGLTVEGVMDEEQIKSNQGTEFDAFRQAGLDVRIDGNAGLMHHKVFIIDEKIVVFGSYNFSRNAETQNDENLIIVHNADIAQQFMQEFQRVWTQAHQ
jgi:phosphatidylserine/phosphatidylglycerophosphate/cardiolipin synthase-like enzyme